MSGIRFNYPVVIATGLNLPLDLITRKVADGLQGIVDPGDRVENHNQTDVLGRPFVAVVGDDSVRLWRCDGCGKWSHAKRRPRHHERFVPAAALPDDAKAGDVVEQGRILRIEEGWYSSGPDGGYDGGARVACGPFSAWRAVRESEGAES